MIDATSLRICHSDFMQDKEQVAERLHEFRETIPPGHKFPIEPQSARVCRYCPLSYPRRESRLTQLGPHVLTPHLYDLKEVLPNLKNSQIAKQLPELHGAGKTNATYFLGEFRLWIANSRRQPSGATVAMSSAGLRFTRSGNHASLRPTAHSRHVSIADGRIFYP